MNKDGEKKIHFYITVRVFTHEVGWVCVGAHTRERKII